MIYRNSEGYSDPTAGQALRNIAYEELRRSGGIQRVLRAMRSEVADGRRVVNLFHVEEDMNLEFFRPGPEALAEAIILQACDDYRWARGTLNRRPDHRVAMTTLRECERFFRSDWFAALSDVPGKSILEKLRQESV